ncbi:SMI1/KNR4 family protein [Dactylosporangium sp. NPDC000555]|uniref:SMI1/KNR4 family protein n=1 Tax=Dactylosporangium sp. NPDC000555 TaxID=3154260 RepID=UPI003332783C
MDIQRLADIAAELRRRDLDAQARGRPIGGGGYGPPSTPVTVKNLDAVEAQLGVALPAEYRAFMLAFGADLGQGWGGLVEPRRLPGLNFARDEFAYVRRPFTMVDGACAGRYEHEDASDSLVDGALIIAEHGCTFRTIMVVTGDRVGTVWDNDWSRQGGPHEYRWLPAGNGSSYPRSRELVGAPVMFLDWVEPWVNASVARRASAARRSTRPGLLGRLRRLQGSR